MFVKSHGRIVAAPDVQAHEGAALLRAEGAGMIKKPGANLPVPAAFLHAKIVDIQLPAGSLHGAEGVIFDNAEAVAKDPVCFLRHENRTYGILKKRFQLHGGVFQRGRTENIRTDPVMHLPYLMQKSDKGRDISRPAFLI